MPPRKRAKKNARQKTVIKCAGAGCCYELVVDEGDENMVTFCDSCYDKVHADRDADEEEPYWFVSHVDHSHIVWSSDKSLVSITPSPLGECSEPTLGDEEATHKAAELIASANAIFVTAGAGCSIDSGLPDFRGRGGWYQFDGKDMRMDQVDFKPASPHLLSSWNLIGAMVAAFRSHMPHAGYRRLVASLFPQTPGPAPAVTRATSQTATVLKSTALTHAEEERYPRAFVLTTNIDNYFEASGVPTASLLEAHGTVEYLQCTSVGTSQPCEYAGNVWPFDAAAAEKLAVASLPSSSSAKKGANCCRQTNESPGSNGNPNTPHAIDHLPRCRCGALARPNVSHSTDSDDDICLSRKAAQYAAMRSWLVHEHQIKSELVVLEIGCGTSPHALRRDSEIIVAKHRGRGGKASLIRVDPGNAAVPHGGGCVGVALGAREALLKLFPA